MKKIILIGLIFGLASLFSFTRSILLGNTDITSAQISDSEYQKLLDRDKNIPQKKIDDAFAEAKKIQESVLAIVAAKKPEFKLHRSNSGHLISHPPGRRGTTRDEMTWRTGKTQLGIQVHLGLKKEDELILFRERLEHLSMGDFFKISNIGDEAILVKNVLHNTGMTNVGLHFVKGRVLVDVSVKNHQRKTEKNEKELMEVVRLIEPLIVARANFED